MSEIKLLGRIFIICEIETITGLYIGNKGGNLEIGGVDNPIIRHSISREPYIPGSSLRGKMRSQLEKKLGKHMNTKLGMAKIHSCQKNDLQNPCPVCKIFGISANENGFPTRLVVRDVRMTKTSIEKLLNSQTDQLFTETKWENAIDRVTAVANPRNIERVPSEVVFGPAELIFSLYEVSDIELLRDLLDCMQLVEDDYLGGGGSRGNGKVKFSKINISVRSSENYSYLIHIETYENLQKIEADLENLKQHICQMVVKG